ncbi:sensor histidine kinase [Persicitalea sp.]|uniref:sensor histidine kinase n=1 Tax=Persicitalea sp. TaxID=3100273 RepID=UPI003594847B
MASSSDANQAVADLANYLFNRRDAILNQWRTTCENDPTLSHLAALNREEFNNLLPLILNIMDQRLRHQAEAADPLKVAHAHGLHRWHKGRSLMDILTELDYLYEVIGDELLLYRQQYPNADPEVLMVATVLIARLKSETVKGSVSEYDTLQQLAAAGRGASLQQALDQLNQLGRDRSDLLRTSSHDLKSTFGVIQGATFLLSQEGKTEEERAQLMQMLNRNLTNVRTMLVQLTDLARLEAGQEPLEIQAFDASKTIRELVESAQPLASEKNLVLRADGPETLIVESDAVKIQRIVQNLLLNAIRYTAEGMVSVSWSSEGTQRWYVSVQDSGPGLPSGTAALLARQLEPDIEVSAVMKRDLTTDDVESPAKPPPAKTLGGEGIGLHIVKRLCDLLQATLEVETQSGRGTIVRVRLSSKQEA